MWVPVNHRNEVKGDGAAYRREAKLFENANDFE